MNDEIDDARLRELLIAAHPTAPFPDAPIHAAVAGAARGRGVGVSRPRTPGRPRFLVRLGLGIAAAAAIFTAGGVYGARTRDGGPEPASLPLGIQAAGSAWVARVAGLADADFLTPSDREAARQVTIATLYAATLELRRAAPQDGVLMAIEGLLQARRAAVADPAPRLAAVWF